MKTRYYKLLFIQDLRQTGIKKETTNTNQLTKDFYMKCRYVGMYVFFDRN